MRRVGAGVTVVGVVVVVALAGLLVAAALPIGGPGTFSVRALASRGRSVTHLTRHVNDVVGSNIPARLYGGDIARLENGGTNASGQLVSDLSPIPAWQFREPIARYRSYAVRWSHIARIRALALLAALRSGTRLQAQRAWLGAWTSYLRLGAVYGLLGKLDRSIDGMPGELGERSFTGLHRIELGLWSGAPVVSLESFAAALVRNVARLPAAVDGASITPLDYATRAHEILEDAQRDLLSGMDVPWSGAGVAGTAAGVATTQVVLDTLAPLLEGRDNTLVEVQNELALLADVLMRIRTAHGGEWPSLHQLTTAQRDVLDGMMAGALGQLAALPGTLETVTTPIPPALP